MVYSSKHNELRTNRISTVEAASPTVKTLRFVDNRFVKAQPGQFLMLWIPRVDEIPLSILDVDENGVVAVMIRKVGEATRVLCSMECGDTVGVRGPFGNSFTIKKGRVLLVGGGTGIAPLVFLAKELSVLGVRPLVVIGAKTKEELLGLGEFDALCSKENLIVATEDGSYGVKCLVTEPLESLSAKNRFDMIYTCGPEKMMRKVLGLAEKWEIDLEASLERLMRCAIGLCGSCVIGRYRVCRDGPVFTKEQLRCVKTEFGVSKLDFDGRRVPLS